MSATAGCRNLVQTSVTHGTAMSDRPTKVVITGASGLLGRSLARLLTLSGVGAYDVVGLAYSRVEPPLRKLDLLDAAVMSEFLREVKPDVVVHCAAERFPDRVAADPDRARALNVDVSTRLAAECAGCGASLIFLSTDYVFDGGVKSGVFAPYAADAPTMPLQLYGETKRAGEEAVLAVPECHPLVLRVPVLYGYDQVRWREPRPSAAFAAQPLLNAMTSCEP